MRAAGRRRQGAPRHPHVARAAGGGGGGVQQGARLLAVFLGDEAAANEAKFRRKLCLSLADAALPMLVAAAGRLDVPPPRPRGAGSPPRSPMEAEEELAGTLGRRRRRAPRPLRARRLADADARLPGAGAERVRRRRANGAALVGFGAIQPLLMATAIPGAGKDHAREALRRLNKHELWRNSDAQRNHVGGEAKGEAMTPARRKKVEVEELELLTDSASKLDGLLIPLRLLRSCSGACPPRAPDAGG